MTDDQPDTAKQLNPVLMFDDKERDQGPGVKDFRPISEFVEKNRGRSRISDEPPDPENPFGSPNIAPENSSDAPNIAPPKVTVGTESDNTTPPEEALTPELTEPDEGAPTDDEDDDIPSPWDEPTSD